MKMNINNRGYALLFALVVVAILLVVALAVSRVSFQEVRISDTAQDSQKALNATNSGAECAMYFDRRVESVFGNDTEITCSNEGSSMIEELSPGVYFFVAHFADGQCAHVTVDKSGMLENRTVIESRGYNICPDGDERNPRRLERAVLVEYEFGGGDQDLLVADISIVVQTAGAISGSAAPGISKLRVLKDTLKKFTEDTRPLLSGDGVQLGLTEYSNNGKILFMLTTDADMFLAKIESLSQGGAQNAAGGVFLGTDVIEGNPESLIQNDSQPVSGGRNLNEGEKFIFLVTGGGINQRSIEFGNERGQQVGGLDFNAFYQAVDAVQEAKEAGIVVITFGIGDASPVGHDALRYNLASDSDQWDRCAEFDFGVCYFEISDIQDLDDFFNLKTIFGGGYIHWQPL